MNDFMYSAREGVIRFNYTKAIEQAERLEEIASRIRGEISGDISDILEETRQSWKGDRADYYYRKVKTLFDELKIAANNYEKIAGTIRNIARRNYDREMSAIRIARERSYRGNGQSHGGGGRAR